MCRVEERLLAHFFEILGALLEHLEAAWLEGADRFRQVAEVGRVVEVEDAARVVGDDPGQDGVLRQVLLGAAGERVEEHEVVEVAELALVPELLHEGNGRGAEHGLDDGMLSEGRAEHFAIFNVFKMEKN